MVTFPVEYLSITCCLCSVIVGLYFWGFLQEENYNLSWSIHSALECFLNFVEEYEMGTCGRRKVGFNCKLLLLQSLSEISLPIITWSWDESSSFFLNLIDTFFKSYCMKNIFPRWNRFGTSELQAPILSRLQILGLFLFKKCMTLKCFNCEASEYLAGELRHPKPIKLSLYWSVSDSQGGF